MPVVEKIMVATGQYQNDQGETKTRWQECGVIFEKDGKRSIKMNALPTSQFSNGQHEPWSGWMRLFPADNQRSQQAPAHQATHQAQPPQGGEPDFPF